MGLRNRDTLDMDFQCAGEDYATDNRTDGSATTLQHDSAQDSKTDTNIQYDTLQDSKNQARTLDENPTLVNETEGSATPIQHDSAQDSKTDAKCDAFQNSKNQAWTLVENPILVNGTEDLTEVVDEIRQAKQRIRQHWVLHPAPAFTLPAASIFYTKDNIRFEETTCHKCKAELFQAQPPPGGNRQRQKTKKHSCPEDDEIASLRRHLSSQQSNFAFLQNEFANLRQSWDKKEEERLSLSGQVDQLKLDCTQWETGSGYTRLATQQKDQRIESLETRLKALEDIATSAETWRQQCQQQAAVVQELRAILQCQLIPENRKAEPLGRTS
ncbi:MAG: hypothetical protein LQ337_007279 [Flavoplaca oasis]|nr:MAG: hypothetical protein LQ337_007279 [Flavoplaca oasis]